MNRVPLVLAGVLVIAAAAELLAPAADVTSAAAPVSITGAGAAALVSASDTGTWQNAILARPLFRPDRKPLTAAPAMVAAALPRLTAIVMTAAGASAIFDGDDGKPVIVVTGGNVAGYKIQSISPDRVELAGPDGRTVLRPQFASPAAAAAAGTTPIVLPSRLLFENE